MHEQQHEIKLLTCPLTPLRAEMTMLPTAAGIMKERLLPRRRLQITRRHPFLMAAWLGLRNRVHRMTGLRRKAAASTFLALVISVSFWLLAWSHPLQANQALGLLQLYSHWVAILAVLHSAMLVARRKRELTVAIGRSWLIGTPRAAATSRTFIALKTFGAVAWQLAAVLLIVKLLQSIALADANIASSLTAILAGAFVIGSSLGWAWPDKTPAGQRRTSKYIPKRRTKRASTLATLEGLSRWPVARAFAWATPDTVRWPAMAALMSVSAGSSALTGIATVMFWMLIVYMVVLLNSTCEVACEAAFWLRSTPLSFERFVAAVAGRSFLHQLIASLLVTTALSSQMNFSEAVLIVSPWIAVVVLAYSTTISYSFRSASGAKLRLALLALVIGAAETAHRGLALPLSLLIAAWQLRLRIHAPPALSNGG